MLQQFSTSLCIFHIPMQVYRYRSAKAAELKKNTDEYNLKMNEIEKRTDFSARLDSK